MGAPVREGPSWVPRGGRLDHRLLGAVGWSLAAHVLFVVVAVLVSLYAPAPTVFEPPPGPMVDLMTPRGDSKVFKVGPLAAPSGRKPSPPPKAAPPKEAARPEPPKPEPPKVEPKPEPPKPEPPKVEPKPEPPKEVPKPKPEALPEPKKPEPPKPEPKKEEAKKPEPKPAPKKEEAKKPEPKPEPKKEEAKKPEAKPQPKEEAKKPAPAKEDPKATKEEAKTPEAKPGPAGSAESPGTPGGSRDPDAGRSGDPSGGGGGAGNRSPEFYAYFAYMYETIKSEWVWTGEADATLVATVRFSILPDGNLADARIVERSRSPQYDDSALNAVRAARQLTPPPPAVRADFEDVELEFRAGDLMRP